jgi:ATP-dependent exoDNAse (exonuclease V) alpha subunit
VQAGSIKRVTFHNAENGFCVLRIKARGHRDLVTVVGHAAEISAGEWVTVRGTWVNSREHGQQFKASFLRTSALTIAEGIEKYLGSGMILGIGPTHDVDTLAAEPAIFLPTLLRDERHREVARTIPWALSSPPDRRRRPDDRATQAHHLHQRLQPADLAWRPSQRG